ncbi:MAG: long-chain fatty aldehyde decarbonylase [Deltaproteobacteria bacterium]|nr:long-chain fatty aldehyde decarbonylase [Deltaproteobacteria bacterium]
MRDFLSAYSIQHWLESCPQGYLENTQYGHPSSESEPELVLQDPLINEQAITLTVQLVAGERCALAASSALINLAPDEPSKLFLATQTLDEARHVEIFKRRLFDLGVKQSEVEDVIARHANPNLVKFAEILLEKIDKGDFVAGVVGQNIVLEGMAFNVFEMLYSAMKTANPKFAHTLTGTIADERRHVGFGENRIGALIKEYPEKKSEIQKMQKEMSYFMLATFADRFRDNRAMAERQRMLQESGESGQQEKWQGQNLAELSPEEMEALLADTVLKAFKVRLERIGLEYQSPDRP